jgi:hypothetical protein
VETSTCLAIKVPPAAVSSIDLDTGLKHYKIDGELTIITSHDLDNSFQIPSSVTMKVLAAHVLLA